VIARMVKIEIIGPNGVLQEVLTLLGDLGVFQIERDSSVFIAAGDERKVRTLLLDEKSLAERIFYQDLRARIEGLFCCLPQVQTRRSYLDPESALESVARTIQRHGVICQEWCRKRESLRKELAELGRYHLILAALEPYLGRLSPQSSLDFIGVTLKDPAALDELMQVLSALTQDRFETLTNKTADGTLIGLVVLEKALAHRVRSVLSEQQVPEMTFPAALAGLPFLEKIDFLRTRIADAGAALAALDAELEGFARRWGAIYARVQSWINDRLALFQNVAYLHQTGMCFFIHGWTPLEDVARLEQAVQSRFGGGVVVVERQILEQDLDLVPVTLRNYPYFRPFELFARFLPLPRYASIDPTPFLAIGFPLFFGMILGDAGYGALLLLLALGLLRHFKAAGTVRDAAKILLISSCYTIVFGACYGEFFGEIGARFPGWEGAFLVERRRALVPMLYFTLAIGLAHATLGLLLGAVTSLRRKTGREALFKLVNIGVILCLGALSLTFGELLPGLCARPLTLALLLLIPLLFYSGGLLAPLELMKNLGNIISYSRIMAIGIASVLLARVANSFAGLTGNLVAGVLLALLFHLVNLALGVFSPAIHALRLHYVEFYSKFVIPGGRRFEPFKSGLPPLESRHVAR
jgi:V/A-type H+/Na+-transporting ATPase subunit I